MVSKRGFVAHLPIGPLRSRPRLVGAIAVGVIVGTALGVLPNTLRLSSRAILGWDAACAWFVAACFLGMSGMKGDHIRSQAAKQDDGRGMILGLVLLASAASLGSVGVELSLAKAEHGLAKILRVLFALATVSLSWFVAQLIFALHYAHEYYSVTSPDPDSPIARGLKFPGEGDPDYWDFLHFSVVIGVASQTADISFESRRLRRIGTVHSLLAFAFNTIVVALTINLWAGVF
jgi:uncharacterized membrane protein